MAFLPKSLLSLVARDRCILKLKELSPFIYSKENIKQKASVLVSLCVHNDEVCLLYTLRSTNLKNHSGQVSFPGGKADPNESIYDTALRETEEEIGVPRSAVDIWHEMASIQGRNKDIVITPIVGEIKNFDRLVLKRNVDEVDEIFTVPIKDLSEPDNHGHLDWRGTLLPVYLCGKHKIWGITGMITHLFLQCFLPSDIYVTNFEKSKFSLEELKPSKL